MLGYGTGKSKSSSYTQVNSETTSQRTFDGLCRGRGSFGDGGCGRELGWLALVQLNVCIGIRGQTHSLEVLSHRRLLIPHRLKHRSGRG